MSVTKATVEAFRPSQHGFQVRTNKGMFYVSKELFPAGIEPGVIISFTEHKKGEAYPSHFKKAGEFKADGIHDVMIDRSNSQANIVFKNSLVKVTEEA